MYLRSLIFSLTLLFCTTPLFASTDDYRKAQSLVEQSTFIVQDFSVDPNYQWMQENLKMAKAILVIPQSLRGGFIFGGSGGTGVLISRNDDDTWSNPAFYTLASISVGLQIGADASQIVLLIMTEKGMNSLLATSFKLGADASVAAGPVGGGARAATTDVYAYSKAQGLFGGATVEGAVVSVRDSLNSAYYKKAVTPVDIIVRKNVANPEADVFRHTVTELARRSEIAAPVIDDPFATTEPAPERQTLTLPPPSNTQQNSPTPTDGGDQVFQ